ncbi:MAG TPA: sugar transferase [Candidatus Limnocylindrales bacterium]|nr:sugar transferase [Candidatus Limnocylindrales bacterium]
MADLKRKQNRVLGELESPWLLPTVDVILALLSWVFAYFVRYQIQLLRPVNEPNTAPFPPYVPYALAFALFVLVGLRGAGLYKFSRTRTFTEELFSIISTVAGATVVLMALSFLLQPLVFSRLMLVYVAFIAVALMALGRLVRRQIYARLRSRGVGVERVLVVGAGDVGLSVLRTLLARKELGYVVVGYLDDNPDRGSVDLGRVRGLGGTDQLKAVIVRERVDHVMITLPWTNHPLIFEMVQLCQRWGLQVSVAPDVFQLNLRQVQIENFDSIPMLYISGQVPLRGGGRLVKRSMDLLLVIVSAPIWVPVFALVALAVRLDSPGPVFYSALRVGENGAHFKMRKFRSMVPDAEGMRESLIRTHELDPRHPKIKDDPRVTRVGRFIRRTSLDELPNVLNVLSGHMSLIGPRPPTPDEVTLYAPWHMQRLQVRPGMTGLWQVSGRSDIPFDEMCLLDIYYIENWSLQMDARILLMTIPHVLLRRGAY